jgi:hypothetical protein
LKFTALPILTLHSSLDFYRQLFYRRPPQRERRNADGCISAFLGSRLAAPPEYWQLDDPQDQPLPTSSSIVLCIEKLKKNVIKNEIGHQELAFLPAPSFQDAL